MAKRGRPTKYSKELAARICNQLSEGISLRTVCLADDMPTKTTVFTWLQNDKDFLGQYARAKEESADAMAEDILDIADETNKVIKSGAEKKSGAYAQAQRLRVDTRKWIMSKMKPKKYGDSIDVTSDHKALPAPIYGGLSKTNGVQGHDSNKKDISTPKKD